MRWISSLFISTTIIATGAAQPLPLRAPQHLTISTSVSAPTIQRGKQVSLFVDVTPKPKIHVYAPGATDYQPIKLTIEPHPGITVQQLHYPKSTLLVNEFEKVPVYDKAFRLVQDLTIAPKSGTGTVTVKGSVDYQACDDEVCFKPATIPVSWTIDLKP